MSPRSYGPLLDALRGVRWPARRAVGAALPGAHRSRQRGTSGEFTEYRLYRQGDDPRQLDWKLLGRSDRAFVRLTDDRALLSTWFVVDASASMRFPASDATAAGSGPPSKWSLACALTVGLAAVANASGDPIGLIVTGQGGPIRLAARTRRGTLGAMANTLDRIDVGADMPLSPLLNALPAMARVVIISDLLGDGDALLRVAAQRTVAGGIVECLHVVAREELSLPSGIHLARDPDATGLFRPMDGRMQADYRTRFDAFRQECAQRWRAAGAGYMEARTDVSVARMVRQIAGGLGRGVAVHGASHDAPGPDQP
ncbi:MAG: DUF58 domain-containing protein [Gemmatimonadaceae bacterium]|nr:DUF58 domain-containing protein [Gemmatimonadaceae bacterium]